ncbi:MAG: hypothetical protein CK428_33110 [Mycobacterium sp.]|nr:MAG: hypothetical protein CK428_33110 [Mycobacterium sp.]
MTTAANPWVTADNDQAQSLLTFGQTHEDTPSHETDCWIDELAIVQVCTDGLRLRLRGAERDEAIRRMHGRVAIDLIAWRLYTTPRTVQRTAARLGLVRHHTMHHHDDLVLR